MTNTLPNHGVLKPGIALMQSLRLSTKLALVGALIFVPMVSLTVQAIRDQSQLLASTRNERAGASAVTALLDVAVQTQVDRGQTHMLLSGSTAAKDLLPATRTALQAAIAQADGALAHRPGWQLDPEWQSARKALLALGQESAGADRVRVFQQHTEQINALRHLVQRVGEVSELLFDPQAVSYFLVETAVERLLPWTETTGLLRGQGAGLLTRGEITFDESAAIFQRIGLLETQLHDVQDKADALKRFGESPAADFATAVNLSQRFIDDARRAFADGKVNGAANEFFASGTRAIEASVRYERQSIGRLQDLLTARDQELTLKRNLSLALALLGLGAIVYVGAAFHRSMMAGVQRVQAAAQAGAHGDLTVQAAVPGRDELADMGREIDRMTGQLTGLVQGIRHHANDVATAGQQVASDSQALSERTSEQASSVEQSSVALAQVAQAVRDNGAQVEKVHVMFSQVRASVDEGAGRMQAVVSTMADIESASRRVTEIIGVIDGIAFQTNILALNAAVEAARAGESGRGFAVVASEVRSLAGRCSQAAGEIRTLIAASTDQVAVGVGQIHGARDSLTALLAQADEVTAAMQALARSTREQTLGVEQVNDGVRGIGDMTMRNAQGVEAAASLAQDLRERARSLQSLVAAIKLAEVAADPGAGHAPSSAPGWQPAPAAAWA